MNRQAQVYVRLDQHKTIIEINSSIFIEDINNWIKIDEGYGDKYCHAQGNYLPNGLIDNFGKYNYKYDNGYIIELTSEEKENLYPIVLSENKLEELDRRVTNLETLHNIT